MDRREFLKKAFQVGGMAALYNLGVTLEQANAWGVMPMSVMDPAAGGPYWHNWDEQSEDTLFVDQDEDGTEDLFVVFGEGGNSTDETGRGAGLSGADLVWSQSGAMAGNGSYRTLDGSDDYFSVTSNFRDILDNLTQYGIIFKMEDWNPGVDYEALIRWASEVIFRVDNARKLTATIDGTIVGTTTNALPTSGVVYCYLGCDGSDTMVGFTTSGSGTGGQPTKKSDFAANDRALKGSAIAMPNLSDADTDIFRDSDSDNRNVTGKFHYAVWRIGDPLIDFSS